MSLISRSGWDRFAMGASALCFVHCALMPFVVALFPALAALGLDDESFHQAMLWLVIPTSVIGVALGRRHHKDWIVLLGAIVSLVALTIVAFWGHDLLGELGERVVSAGVAILLALTHWRNFKFCRNAPCC